MTGEAVITVRYQTRYVRLERASIAYIDSFRNSDAIAEQFEMEADRCIKYVSDLLAHQHGRKGVNDPPAIKRRISNRQKVQLVQEIIDTGSLSSKQIVEQIREALKR